MARVTICLVVFLLAVLASAASDDPLTTVQQPSQVGHGATMEEERSLPVKQDEGEENAASKAVHAGGRRDGEPVSSTLVEEAKMLEHHRGMERKLDNDDDGDDWDSVDNSDSDHDSNSDHDSDSDHDHDSDSDSDRSSDSDHDSDSNHDFDDDDDNDDDDNEDDDDDNDEHKTNKTVNKKKKRSASGGRRVGPGGNKN